MPHNEELVVTTSTVRYPVIVEAGALERLPHHLASLRLDGALWLVSDSAVYPRHGLALEERLRGAGYTVYSRIIPSGEASKNLDQLSQLYSWMLDGGVERRDTVLALGGGVVGDIAGFAAASILRGIALVQLPTTLLAMVDAAVGGKTGVNHPLGKNLIGAFYQPRLVLADTQTLRTLPSRELRAGWAEVIKHGVIRDAGLFDQLEHWQAEYGALSIDLGILSHQTPITDIIRRAVAVKVAVVSADEREQGERIILNYGHTVGHALEAAMGYGMLLHGEAVAIGMHAEARIAAAIGLCTPELVERQQQLLSAYGLAAAFPVHADREAILALMLRDKKVERKRIRWVLPTALGAVAVRDDVPVELVRETLLGLSS
ncbi:MAG: 3-dehydroquinate synthase [Chloroflexales bacterium]|nr:3-dehydroquinate synthase [Chloroflexales bacterium]